MRVLDGNTREASVRWRLLSRDLSNKESAPGVLVTVQPPGGLCFVASAESPGVNTPTMARVKLRRRSVSCPPACRIPEYLAIGSHTLEPARSSSAGRGFQARGEQVQGP